MNEVFKNAATIENEALKCIKGKLKGIEYVHEDIKNVTHLAENGTLVLKGEAKNCMANNGTDILDESTKVICLEKVE